MAEAQAPASTARVGVRIILLVGLFIVALALAVAGLAVEHRLHTQRYVDVILPGVAVWGFDVGGMNVEAAAAQLAQAFPDPSVLSLTLRDGDRTWGRTWADLGIHFDPGATAQVAYRIGRSGAVDEQYIDQLQVRLAGWTVSPVVVLPDAEYLTAVLSAFAPEVEIAAVDASLEIGPDGTIPIPAKVGRELDLEETVENFPFAVGVGPEGLIVELLSRQVAPLIGNPGEAMAEAEAFLGEPFILSGSDQLTGFSSLWTVSRSDLAQWLKVVTAEDEDGPFLQLTILEEPISLYLAELSASIGGGLGIDVERTTQLVRVAVESREHESKAILKHLSSTYPVRAGDTLISIGQTYGFPVWRLVQANPDVDPAKLRPGDAVVIPSIDVLFEFPLITSRRIVVDMSDQRLYAYEGEAIVFNYLASTGIEESPTIPGTFQILTKDEEAYASIWDLWMPHFMGLYRTAPDFTNGIHGLPTLSGGRQLWAGYLGSPVSYGCVVIGLDEARALFDWAELGTLVVIQP
ncbi:MAG: L,D-transpeptidase family protein [Anaerolineae bacterium]|nr:L,D-transpeptidase family protein [Anaerolineae bacterium]